MGYAVAVDGSEVTAVLGPRHVPRALEMEAALAEVQSALFGVQPKPIRLSRYVLLDRIGSGGVGIVYEAYDPELDRKVAIKLLRSTPGAKGEGVRRKRMMREAQAIARLSHPNVVTVHDVGTYDPADLLDVYAGPSTGATQPEVFVVMEFVRGLDLDRWVAAAPRSWRDILAVFSAAGRGLQAAHAEGIIHRDFKPSNVLVDEGGQVRVLDFGLARSLAEPREGDETLEHSTSALDLALTREGSVMGTPTFMSPEQHRGARTDVRSDQYSFCVALYSALYGRSPFAGSSIAELALAKQGGARVPGQTKVPARIGRALVRGLSVAPEDRFPDMQALLDALDGARARRRTWVVGALVGALALGALVSSWPRPAASFVACEGLEAQVDRVWNEDTRARVRDSFTSTGRRYASDAYAAVETGLDRYLSEWLRVRREVCQSALDREYGPERLEGQILCLERRLDGVDALVEAIGRDPLSALEHAHDAVNRLTPIEPCTDPALSTPDDRPRDPQTRQRLAELERDLVRAQTWLDAARWEDAHALATDLVERARTLGYDPALARALVLLGRLQAIRGEAERAEWTLFDAYVLSERAGLGETGVRAQLARMDLARVGRDDLSEAERIGRLIDAKLDALELGGELRALQGLELGKLRRHQGRYDESLAALRAVLQIRERLDGPDSVETAAVRFEIGSTLYKQRKFDEAARSLRSARDSWRRTLGEHHPILAHVEQRLGNIAWRRGHYAEAVTRQRRAVELDREARGPDHLDTIMRTLGLSAALLSVGQGEEALELARTAVDAYTLELGPDNSRTALAVATLGSLLVELGRHDEALPWLQAAHDTLVDQLGPDHPETAYLRNDMGRVACASGEPELARAHFDAAARLWARELGPRHPKIAWVLQNRGDCELRTGRGELAVASYRRGMALHDVDSGDPAHLAAMEFGLARALGPGSEACALADQARARLIANPFRAGEAKAITQWSAQVCVRPG